MHGITVARGNGLVGSPVNRPAVTVYTAHFTELMPWQPFTYPPGAGGVTPTPAPQAHPGLPGLHHPARTPVSVAATPAAGYSLYRLYTAFGPVSQSPKTTYNPEWVLAYFTPQSRTTITTSPPGRWLWVDGQFYEGPVNFSPFYPADGDWSAGTVHQLDVAVDPQLPFSYSIRYPWLNWSDGGARSHVITVPAGNATRTARFGTQYYAATWAQQPCAGSVSTSPAPPDGFHDSGSTVSFLQAPVAGWTFTGWLHDFTGTTQPKSLVMNDERLMVANYNAVAAPVAITGLTPATKVAGQPGFTLKIAGTGFTANSSVFIGGSFRAPTAVTAKQIQVPVTAADIANAGALQVFVQTTPAGSWSCSAHAARSLQVRSSTTQPLATPSPNRLQFSSQAVGTTSAAQQITLSNGGNTPLALHDVLVTGPQAADFTLSHNCGNALGASSGCSIDVRFRPTATGARGAMVRVVDTAFDSPQNVEVSGTGAP